MRAKRKNPQNKLFAILPKKAAARTRTMVFCGASERPAIESRVRQNVSRMRMATQYARPGATPMPAPGTWGATFSFAATSSQTRPPFFLPLRPGPARGPRTPGSPRSPCRSPPSGRPPCPREAASGCQRSKKRGTNCPALRLHCAHRRAPGAASTMARATRRRHCPLPCLHTSLTQFRKKLMDLAKPRQKTSTSTGRN